MSDAQESQVAVEVACGCLRPDGGEQTTLVRDYRVAEWRCGACRHKAHPTGRSVTLGRRGALPADWRTQPVEAAA